MMEAGNVREICIRCVKPQRKLLEWAIALTVANLLPCAGAGLLKSSKKRSLSSGKSRFIFAFAENEPVGFCAFRVEKALLFIYELHVSEGYRSLSVGTKMLEQCKRARPEHIQSLALRVRKNNHRGIAFYERNGFEREDCGNVSEPYTYMHCRTFR